MKNRERMKELRNQIEEQRKLIEIEEEKIEQVKACCGRVAELLCTHSGELAAGIMECALEQTISFQQREVGKGERGDLERTVLMLLQEQTKECRSLASDKDIWPHIECKIRINLKGKLQETRFQLKRIENKMLDGTRAQLRKCAVQMEEMKNICSRMEQALLSIESWEKLFLMFMDDMEIRRRSGMDDMFYRMEREDIRRKLHTCFEFSETIRYSLEGCLCSAVRDRMNLFGGILAERGFYLPKALWNRCGTKTAYRGVISLPQEMREELDRYTAGILFIEKHLYNIMLAEEEIEKAKQELTQLSEEMQTRRMVV